MRSVATIEYQPSIITKEEAMLSVEHKAFDQIMEKIRGKEFKYLKINTSTKKIFGAADLACSRCSIYLEEIK
jgi:hypothetical protein